MASKKLITVFGATGNQGGSVVRSVLEHPKLNSKFRVRGVTRSATSEKAKALTAKGVEMVEADLNDPKTISRAIANSSVVFGVTNFWDPSTLQKEASQGKALADACSENGVDLLIWSSLPSKAQIDEAGPTGTNIKVIPHFETKAAVENYIKTELKGKLDAAFVHPGLFAQNYLSPLFTPRKGENGSTYTVNGPFVPKTENIPIYNVEDMGIYVAALLLSPKEKIVNKQWFAASSIVSSDQITAAASEATGKKIVYNEIPLQTWAGFLPEHVREELADNMALVRKPGYFGSDQAAKDGVKAYHDLIDQTEAGKLTNLVDFFRQNLKVE